MGRGRQKAKQTKVARKLKYYSPETDLEALQRELAAKGAAKHTDSRSKYAVDEDEGYADDTDDRVEIPPAWPDDDLS